ncbi:sulfotransferase family 2 domain-containing protein [Lacinutrix cladophorae]
MIVNHEHKFIFVKTQKTASTSLEIALSSLCGEEDIVTPISTNDELLRQELGYQSPVNYNIPFSRYSKKELLDYVLYRTKNSFYNHISCDELKLRLGSKIYDSYYKFCFERNPYDKAISLFYHQGGFKKWNSIENFIKDGGLKIIKGYDQYSINNIVAVDDVFKFENMDNALKIISEKLNLKSPIVLSKIKAKSQFRKDKRPYAEVLTKSEKHLIDIIWARERELMGYTF